MSSMGASFSRVCPLHANSISSQLLPLDITAKIVNNTLVCTQLVDFGDEEYTVRVTYSIDEDKQLIEAGFEYIIERDGFKIYRKRK